jgi:UDP-N-acetylmuramyl pentapeptide phosphotransferase/UDP-N-acetylglucosamine-1-phosphate transferase
MLHRLAVVDVPNSRSSHDRPTARGGGIAVGVAITVAVGVASEAKGPSQTAILVAAVGFGVVGLLEDLFGVPPLPRFGLQIAAAIALLPLLLSGLAGSTSWRILCAIAVVLWLVSYVNAFNFMDGINGISVAQAVVAGVTWYVVGRTQEVPALAFGGLIVAAASVGFAPFNFPRARVFLGDVGSYCLGGCIAALAILGIRSGLAIEAMLAPLSLYIADTSSTLFRRVLHQEPWHLPHRDHIYQRLIRRGWSHPTTTLVVGGLMAVSSALGAVSLSRSAPERMTADVLLVALLTGYLAAPAILRRREGHRTGDHANPDRNSLLPS